MIGVGFARSGPCAPGLFTSPHLAEPTERISHRWPAGRREAVRGGVRPRTRDVWRNCCDAGRDRSAHHLLRNRHRHGVPDFREERSGYRGAGSGPGGRLDATNVVHPELCVITPMDFDHEAFLGKSLESIAGEKAGIRSLACRRYSRGRGPRRCAFCRSGLSRSLCWKLTPWSCIGGEAGSGWEE